MMENKTLRDVFSSVLFFHKKIKKSVDKDICFRYNIFRR